MIQRDTTAERINEVVNHPEVHKWVALPGQGALDMSALVADTRNILLMVPEGGLFFEFQEPGVYQVHTQFLPTFRGAGALRVTRDALHWMFCRTDCMELLTKVPVHNVGADGWAKLIGGVLDFEREGAWPTDEGTVAVKYYRLSYADWVRSARGLIERGRWFHERLTAEKVRRGMADAPHPEDLAHDRYVGAAVEMIYGGQLAKAVVLYNRWARFAGYVPVKVVSAKPTIVDIDEALVYVTGDTFEVMPCL